MSTPSLVATVPRVPVTCEFNSINPSTDISNLFERLKVQFIEYHRKMEGVNKQRNFKYPCPLRCNSTGFNNPKRITEHLRNSCRNNRGGISHKRQISTLFLETKKLISGHREGEGSLLKINSIEAASREYPVHFLCQILDSSAPGGINRKWVKRTDLIENNFQNMVSNAYKKLKEGKMKKIPMEEISRANSIRQFPVLSIFSNCEEESNLNFDLDSTISDVLSNFGEPVRSIPKFSDLEKDSSMAVVSQVISELILEESRKSRVRHLISKFIQWVVEKQGWDAYDSVCEWHLYLVRQWQFFMKHLGDSNFAAATVRNYTEDSLAFFKQLNLILIRNGEIYWGEYVKSLSEIQRRWNSIFEKRKLVECGELNSVDSLVTKDQFFSLEELERIKNVSQQVIYSFLGDDLEKVSEYSKSKLHLIQSALLWNIVFQLNPQRTQWFSNIKIGKELKFDSESQEFYFCPTSDCTKMFFHRRQIRHENLGVDMKEALIKFIFTVRTRILNSNKPLDVDQEEEYVEISSPSSTSSPIRSHLVGKPLFLNMRAGALANDGLIKRLREFVRGECGIPSSKMTLRSLRQVFQYHFYRSNPSFAELRDFNRSMDHTDTTGLIYYNRADSASKIHPPSASLISGSGLSLPEDDEYDILPPPFTPEVSPSNPPSRSTSSISPIPTTTTPLRSIPPITPFPASTNPPPTASRRSPQSRAKPALAPVPAPSNPLIIDPAVDDVLELLQSRGMGSRARKSAALAKSSRAAVTAYPPKKHKKKNKKRKNGKSGKKQQSFSAPSTNTSSSALPSNLPSSSPAAVPSPNTATSPHARLSSTSSRPPPYIRTYPSPTFASTTFLFDMQ